ncbi:MAG: YqgE/AlgH family protein [Sterolibacterium sp.]|jgi:putative transcriptional regulator|nr:YqgE/AlgH family protein [Sterolibacterium sp.]
MSTSPASLCLTHHFLIAMPAMTDPNFARALIYVCEHNDQGALGVIINRPADMNVATLYERVEIPFDVTHQHTKLGLAPVYVGGPVQTERGFVLHRPVGQWQSTLAAREDIGLTSTRDILVGIGANGQPRDHLITLGYTGWSAGQLEWELTQNAWLTVAAAPRIIFDLPPEERLAAAMQLLGIDFTHLSDVAGHA